MIVVTLSLDSSLVQPDDLPTPRRIGRFEEMLADFGRVALLTQDTSHFNGSLYGVEHVPCCFSRSRNIRLILARFSYLRWTYFFFSSFFWTLKHHGQINVMISLNIDSPAPFLSVLFGFPYVAYYHYDTAYQVRYINKRPLLGTLLQVLERFAFKRANAVWITSPSLTDKVKSLGAKKIKIIPNWVDFKEIEGIKTTNRESTRSRILFVGRLHKVKQVDLLIRAFHLIQERNPNVDLYILGDGPLGQNLVKLTNDLGLSDSVHFLGYVDQMAVFRMMKLSDVFVLPSKMEGNPRVIIEAMANRVPIVATNVPGIREMLQHMKTGYLIDNDQPEELAHAIEYILSNKRESASMTGRAFEFVCQNFSKERVSQKIRDELKLVQG
jgi:glycosyltransferase involved in cell wall biosynthesis